MAAQGQSRQTHLAIATGGTGGHFFPALSVAREYRRQGGPVSMIIGGHHTEEHLRLAREQGFPTATVSAVRAPQRIIGIPLFAWRLLKSLVQAHLLLRRLKIDQVLGMGSFASIPLGLAAIMHGKPLFLHEGNAVIGRANRWLQCRARLLMLSLPLQSAQTVKTAAMITGFPLRNELLEAAKRGKNESEESARCREQFGLSPNRPTLLVFGGSQGAEFLNQLVIEMGQISETAESPTNFQVLVFTGSPAVAESMMPGLNRQTSLPVVAAAWCEQMAAAYQAADLVLCRAGAATIAELALYRQSAIIVPLPNAMDNHQAANAEVLARHEMALHWPQAETTPQRLLAALAEFSADPISWRRRGQRLGRLAQPHAARQIVEAMINPQPSNEIA